MAQELTTGNRMVSVITSRGEAKKIAIAPAITTWKQLQPILVQAGYVLSNMKVVESIGKATLEHPEAAIPVVSFRLYIMPMESKSGAAKAVPKSAKKVAKKAVKAAKTAKKAKKVQEKAEAVVEINDGLAHDSFEIGDEDYEPTPEELQQEYKNISEGIPGIKRK
jgi:hypothetical protein